MIVKPITGLVKMALVAVVGVVYLILESIGLVLVSEKHQLYFVHPLFSLIQSTKINRFPLFALANLIVENSHLWDQSTGSIIDSSQQYCFDLCWYYLDSSGSRQRS